MAGLSVYAAVTLGLLPSNNFFIALAPLGILSEAVLLSLALAERVKRTQKALEGADRKAMSQLSRYQSVFNNALDVSINCLWMASLSVLTPLWPGF